MQLSLISLCDAASDYQGKLCVLGTFDTLAAAQFPVAHPQCALALRIIFKPEDEGKHTLGIELRDESGKSLMPPIEPSIEIKFPEATPFLSRNLVLNLQRLSFENPGLYHFVVSSDGKELASLPLRVTKVENQRASVGPAG